MFHEAPVAVYALGGSLASLYAKVMDGLAGEASVALPTRLTVPLTIVLAAGLEKVRAGAVLSTRVVTRVEVVELPATSVATTRRS